MRVELFDWVLPDEFEDHAVEQTQHHTYDSWHHSLSLLSHFTSLTSLSLRYWPDGDNDNYNITLVSELASLQELRELCIDTVPEASGQELWADLAPGLTFPELTSLVADATYLTDSQRWFASLPNSACLCLQNPTDWAMDSVIAVDMPEEGKVPNLTWLTLSSFYLASTGIGAWHRALVHMTKLRSLTLEDIDLTTDSISERKQQVLLWQAISRLTSLSQLHVDFCPDARPWSLPGFYSEVSGQPAITLPEKCGVG